MFGAESDRIAAMRAQQQQQYAEDLRRQIEEKQNKAIRQKKTPPAYSTTQSETMQETINNSNYSNNTTISNNNNNNEFNIATKISVRPPNVARQNQPPPRGNYYNSPSRNSENNNLDNTYNQNNYTNDTENNISNNYTNTNYTNNYGNRDDYYSIPTTSTIAPLTLNVPPPSSLMTTTYMMGPTSAISRGSLNADRSTFPSRIESLESRLFNLRDELSNRTEKINDFNDSLFPSYGRDISDLRNRIELESSQIIPQKVQPIRNQIKDHRNLIENINQDQREVHSNVNSSFSDLNGRINTFIPLFNDLQETSKSSFVTLRGDINRHRNQLETSNTKIGKIESQDISIINKLSGLNEDFNSIDKGMTSNFDSLQINTNEIMQNITSSLAYDIQNESQQREVVTTKLQSQVSEVNDRSKSASSRLMQNINQLDFKDSLEEISKQIAAAMNTTNNDTDLKVTDLTRKFDTFLQDCEDNFGSVQNETVSTIESVKSNHMNSMEVIENSLEDENRIRSKNENEISSKYAQFRELIHQEQKIQIENCNRTFNDITFQLKSSINDQLTPMYKDVHAAVYLLSNIEETEAKLEKIEKAVNDTNGRIKEKMTTIQNQFKKLLTEINNERNSMNKKFDEIDHKIDDIQSKNNRRSILKRTEIHAIQKEIEIGLDQKVTSIEDEIAQILRNIAELQLQKRPNSARKSGPIKNKIVSKTDGRTEGAVILENLVNETSKKSNTTKPSSPQNKKKKIYGEQDNSLFLTNNKTLEITSENDNDDDSNDDKEKNEENFSKIGSNSKLETCQRFHFVPPENIYDQEEIKETDTKNPPNFSLATKKASTVRFNLGPSDDDTEKNDNFGNGIKPKKSLSVPKFNLDNNNNNDDDDEDDEEANKKIKFKVDTSFSSNSIKKGSLSLNKKVVSESTSISNSSSSAHQIDDTPLSATDSNKLPFARTNEIEQMLKPEALATLPPHSMSQIIESSANNIFSDDSNSNNGAAVVVEEEEEDKLDVNENLNELDQIPPQLENKGDKLDEFKFNPGDFKIDLNIGGNKNKGEKSQMDLIKDRVEKIMQETNKSDNDEQYEIEEEEEENDDDDN